MNAVQALTTTDLRSIRRDSLLKFLLFYPWALGLFLRFLIPFLTDGFADTFDLSPYHLLVATFFGVSIVPALAGFVVGFLLLDERDDDTLIALQVTPLSMNRYLGYRLALPLLISIASAYVVFALMNLAAPSPLGLLPILILAALEAPIFALLLASWANNKVQGLALMKGMGVFFIVPFVAWFVPEPWQWLLGIIPTYWPAKAFWVLQSGGNIWPWLAAGAIVHLLVLWPLLRRFNRVIVR